MRFVSSLRRTRDGRRAVRRKSGATAWIRIGFAVKACKILDVSRDGVRIEVDAARSVPDQFTLLTSRNAATGQRCHVKWRRGSQIGAEF